jgi:hypothetical protein
MKYIFIAFLISGCSGYLPLQVLTYSPMGAGTLIEQQRITSTDGKVTIGTNLWQDVATSITITNNTDRLIYIDLTASHSIVDGIARSYYKSEVSSTKTSVARGDIYQNILFGVSTTVRTESASLQTIPEPIIAIPAYATKFVEGYRVLFAAQKVCEKISSRKVVPTALPAIAKHIEMEVAYSSEKDGKLAFVRSKLEMTKSEIIPFTLFYQSKQLESCGKKYEERLLFSPYLRPECIAVQYDLAY